MNCLCLLQHNKGHSLLSSGHLGGEEKNVLLCKFSSKRFLFGKPYLFKTVIIEKICISILNIFNALGGTDLFICTIQVHKRSRNKYSYKKFLKVNGGGDEIFLALLNRKGYIPPNMRTKPCLY